MKLRVTVELRDGRGHSRTFDVPLDDDQWMDGRHLDKIAQDAVFDRDIIGVTWDVVE